MSRIAPVKPEEMTPEQKSVYGAIVAKGGRTGGPYTAYLRCPEYMRLHHDIGDYLRADSLPPRLRQLIVLATVRHWDARYAWVVQRRASRQVGLEDAIIDAIDQGKAPPLTDAKDSAAYAVCRELLETRRLGEGTYRRAAAVFKENELVDIVVTTGFFSTVSMTLQAFDIDPPAEPH